MIESYDQRVNRRNGSVREEVLKFAVAIALAGVIASAFAAYVVWRADNTRRALDMIEAPADQPIKENNWIAA